MSPQSITRSLIANKRHPQWTPPHPQRTTSTTPATKSTITQNYSPTFSPREAFTNYSPLPLLINPQQLRRNGARTPPSSAMLDMRPNGGGSASRPRPRRQTLKSVRGRHLPFNRASVSEAAEAAAATQRGSSKNHLFIQYNEVSVFVCASVRRETERGLIACDWGRSGRELITPGRRPIGVATANRQPSRSLGSFAGGAMCCSTFTGLAGMLAEVSVPETYSLAPACFHVSFSLKYALLISKNQSGNNNCKLAESLMPGQGRSWKRISFHKVLLIEIPSFYNKICQSRMLITSSMKFE